MNQYKRCHATQKSIVLALTKKPRHKLILKRDGIRVGTSCCEQRPLARSHPLSLRHPPLLARGECMCCGGKELPVTCHSPPLPSLEGRPELRRERERQREDSAGLFPSSDNKCFPLFLSQRSSSCSKPRRALFLVVVVGFLLLLRARAARLRNQRERHNRALGRTLRLRKQLHLTRRVGSPPGR